MRGGNCHLAVGRAEARNRRWALAPRQLCVGDFNIAAGHDRGGAARERSCQGKQKSRGKALIKCDKALVSCSTIVCSQMTVVSAPPRGGRDKHHATRSGFLGDLRGAGRVAFTGGAKYIRWWIRFHGLVLEWMTTSNFYFVVCDNRWQTFLPTTGLSTCGDASPKPEAVPGSRNPPAHQIGVDR